MKKNMYKDALAHGWRLATKHIWLWPFGLFAAILGQMGITELLTSVGIIKDQYGAATSVQLVLEIFRGSSFASIGNLSFIQWGGAVWVLFIWLLIAACVVFLAVTSQGALIHAGSKASHRIKAFHPASASWHAGLRHFWRIFALNLLKKVGLLLIGLGVAWASYRAGLTGAMLDQLLFVIIFILALFAGMIISFYFIYAACYVVVEEYNDKQALVAAWSLLRDHPIASLEVAIILLLLNVLLALFSVFSFFIFLIPAGVIWLIGAVFASQAILGFAIIVGMLLFVIFVMFLGAMYSIFSTSAWTYMFMHMHKHGLKSYVAHWLQK